MTIEEITYYIETEIKEDEFYGADCDLRRKAHIEILDCLKELQARREAWGKAKRTVKAYLMLEEFGSAYQDDIENLIEGCIPKEVDAE